MTAHFPDPAGGGQAAQDDRDFIRAQILEAPETVLEDPEIMQALLRSQEKDDRKVLDLRAAQLVRLENRLAALRQAHRDVVDAALESMNGVEQTHQATLLLIDADDAESLAAKIRSHLPRLLPIDEARLCLCLDDPTISMARRSTPFAPAAVAPTTRKGRWMARFATRLRSLIAPADDGSGSRRGEIDRDPLDPALVLLPAETIRSRCPKPIRRGPEERRRAKTGPGRPVSISVRDADAADRAVFGAAATRLEAVATITLDLSPHRGHGALFFGAADGEAFRSGHLIEQLAFVGGVIERLIRADDAIDARLLEANRRLGLAIPSVPSKTPEMRR